MTIDFKNNKFSACLLFRSLRDGKFLPSNLWEESIVLIDALTVDEALAKAERIGQSRAASYLTGDGETLTWEFFKVERVFEIEHDGVVDGLELFSRHLRTSEAESLLTPFEDI